MLRAATVLTCIFVALGLTAVIRTDFSPVLTPMLIGGTIVLLGFWCNTHHKNAVVPFIVLGFLLGIVAFCYMFALNPPFRFDADINTVYLWAGSGGANTVFVWAGICAVMLVLVALIGIAADKDEGVINFLALAGAPVYIGPAIFYWWLSGNRTYVFVDALPWFIPMLLISLTAWVLMMVQGHGGHHGHHSASHGDHDDHDADADDHAGHP